MAKCELRMVRIEIEKGAESSIQTSVAYALFRRLVKLGLATPLS
jgi:hypothetical protein